MGKKSPDALWHLVFWGWHLFRMHNMVAEMGFEPHDLRVMSPTSYQAAPLRDIDGAGSRGRTGTRNKSHGILSPGRLPIPPFRHTRPIWSSALLPIYYITRYLTCQVFFCFFWKNLLKVYWLPKKSVILYISDWCSVLLYAEQNENMNSW